MTVLMPHPPGCIKTHAHFDIWSTGWREGRGLQDTNDKQTPQLPSVANRRWTVGRFVEERSYICMNNNYCIIVISITYKGRI